MEKGTPFLGICLGLQLLFEESEESPGVCGLGILPGKILRIPDAPGLKIPHIGWNSLEIRPEARLFRGIENGAYVYFVHSYYLKAEDEAIVAAETEYSTPGFTLLWKRAMCLRASSILKRAAVWDCRS